MAVKVLNAGTEVAVALREVSFLVRAQRHPNIVKFHGVFRNVSVPRVATRAAPGDDTQPCFGKGSDQDDECRQELSVRSWAVAQEWCRHGDLFQFIVDHGPCDEEFGQEVVRGILSGLEWLHELEIVHRDVKSENIAIDDRGPVLLDFGIAAWLRDEKSMKVRCGSPGYAAPEVLSGKAYGCKVDVFGCGVVLYFILSGRVPFGASTIAHVIKKNQRCQVTFESRRFEKRSVMVKEFILWLLEKEREARPTASMALQGLWLSEGPTEEFVAAGEHTAAVPAPAAPPVMLETVSATGAGNHSSPERRHNRDFLPDAGAAGRQAPGDERTLSFEDKEISPQMPASYPQELPLQDRQERSGFLFAPLLPSSNSMTSPVSLSRRRRFLQKCTPARVQQFLVMESTKKFRAFRQFDEREQTEDVQDYDWQSYTSANSTNSTNISSRGSSVVGSSVFGSSGVGSSGDLAPLQRKALGQQRLGNRIPTGSSGSNSSRELAWVSMDALRLKGTHAAQAAATTSDAAAPPSAIPVELLDRQTAYQLIDSNRSGEATQQLQETAAESLARTRAADTKPAANILDPRTVSKTDAWNNLT